MSRPLSHYVAMAVIAPVSEAERAYALSAVQDFSFEFEAFKEYAEEKVGIDLSDSVVKDAIDALVACGLARVSDDPYADTFIKLNRSEFKAFMKRAEQQKESILEDLGVIEQDIYDRKKYGDFDAYQRHPVFVDTHEFGWAWLERALSGIRQQRASGRLLDPALQHDESGDGGSLVPASDRIVRLNDNQIRSVEAPLDEIILAVQQSNGDPDNLGFRERIIGQLRAGRELINVGVFKAWLLEQTVVSALGELIEKYGGTALGIAAAKLLELLLEHMFKGG